MSYAKHLTRTQRPSPIHLTDRDLAVLAALGEHRFLCGGQLRRLVLRCGESRACRRLRALYDHGFVERVSLMPQAIGSLPPFVYELTPKGIATVREMGLPVTTLSLTKDGLRLVRHKYYVNEFYVQAVEAAAGTPLRITNWHHEQQLTLQLHNVLAAN